jgi:hypothetical protein
MLVYFRLQDGRQNLVEFRRGGNRNILYFLWIGGCCDAIAWLNSPLSARSRRGTARGCVDLQGGETGRHNRFAAI